MAAETVDRLQIEIVNNSRGATAPILSLAAALEKLKSAVAGDTATKLKDLADGIKSLKEVGKLSGEIVGKETISNIKSFSNAIEKIDSVKVGTNAMDIAAGIKSIGEADRQSGAIVDKSTMSNIRSFANTMSNLKTESIVPNAEKLAEAIVKIREAGTIGAIADWDTLEGLRAFVKTINAMGTKNVEKKVQSVKKAIKEAAKKEQATDATEKESETGSTTSSAGTDKLIHSTTLLKDISSKAVAPSEELVSKLKEIGDWASFAAKGIAKLAGKMITAPFKALGRTLSRIGEKLKSLVASLGRIALYRALRSVIKSITSGFSEGVKAMYYWSQTSDQLVSSNLDDMATSMQYLRNGFASLASPLITTLAPALEYITNKLVDFFNTCQQTIAVLVGASTWTKAIRKATTYADALDSASDSAKKLQQLMSFDELNNITTPSSSSSGSGDADDYTGLFTTEQVSATAGGWLKAIKEAIENGDWESVGSTLGEKFNSIVNKIKSFNIGEKLGEIFNDGIGIANGFVNSIDWETLGADIATEISDFFATVDWENLGRTIADLADGLTDLVISGIENIDVDAVLDSFEGFLTGIVDESVTNMAEGHPWKRLKYDLDILLYKIYKHIAEWFENTDLGKILVNTFNGGVNFSEGYEDRIEGLIKLRDGMDDVADAYDNLTAYSYDLEDATNALDYVFKLVPNDLGTRAYEKLKQEFIDIASEEGNTKSAAEILQTVLKKTSIPADTRARLIGAMLDIEGEFSTATTKVNSIQSSINGLDVSYAKKRQIIDAFASISSGITGTFYNLGDSAGGEFVKGIKANLEKTTLQVTTTATHSLSGANLVTTGKMNVRAYAQGGFPDAGDLFYANEGGSAELVGSMNGRTAVANTDQIVTGITQGVSQAQAYQNNLLSEQNSLLKQMLKKNLTISPSAGLGRVVAQSERMYRTVTG